MFLGKKATEVDDASLYIVYVQNFHSSKLVWPVSAEPSEANKHAVTKHQHNWTPVGLSGVLKEFGGQ